MNHAERANKLMDRYSEGQGSDQAAIGHALLAINETLSELVEFYRNPATFEDEFVDDTGLRRPPFEAGN